LTEQGMETRQRLYWRLSFIVSAMLALEVLKGNPSQW
jgi:hypothetical protein